MRAKALGLIGAVLVIVAVIFSLQSNSVASADSSDQLARGKEMFRIRCEPCHGDVGQGLALWRYTWAPEDQNCSQYKCHALNHPPDGFYMPKDAPPIIGEGTLKGFSTARWLYDYVSKEMPFDKPGELSSDDYWAVVAFLLHENGKLPDGVHLDATTAGSVTIDGLATPVPLVSNAASGGKIDGVGSTEVIVFSVALAVAILAIVTWFGLRRRQSER